MTDYFSEKKYIFSSIFTFLPGLCQGITRVFISYPFDYIRVYLQKGLYSDTLSVIKANNYKIVNLYRGVKFSLFIIPIDRAISLKFYEDFNKKYNPFLSSIIVSLFTCIYSVPLQSINTNYILDNSNKKCATFIQDLVFKYKTNFLFKSYFVEYCRLFLGSTIYMGLYGNLRNITPNEKKYYIINGIITSLVCWSILYPLDTIRVLHQSNDKKLFYTMHNKYKVDGIRGFYKGISLVYIRTIPSASIGTLVYEIVRNYVNE
jgi:Mitochondrial carrier protein